MIVALRNKQLPVDWTLADLRKHLGGIPPERIRMNPPPGMASVDDVVELADRLGRHFELIDGILVEKVMGWYESLVAYILVSYLSNYLKQNDLGQVLLSDATLKILSNQVRIPDVAFVSWERLPKGSRRKRRKPVPRLVPDLAVEILSKGNTRREMERKLAEYFKAGVRMVWYIDSEECTAVSFTAVNESTEIGKRDSLDGGDVLPGFTISLPELFHEADRQGPR